MENIVLNIKLTSANQLQIFLQFLKSLNFVVAFSVQNQGKKEVESVEIMPKDSFTKNSELQWTSEFSFDEQGETNCETRHFSNGKSLMVFYNNITSEENFKFLTREEANER